MDKELRMSRKERDRLKVMSRVSSGQISQVQAALELRLSARQVRRILQRYCEQGDAGLIHRLRGRLPGNRLIDPQVRTKAIQRLRSAYKGLPPLHAWEKLHEEGFSPCRETLRDWMLQEELWSRERRHSPHRTWRDRRHSPGMLVQLDGSVHCWLEDRGPQLVLLAAIDDASSHVFAQFVPSESAEHLMLFLRRYVQHHGRPLALYVDRDSIFKVNRDPTDDEALQGMGPQTQFARACHDLGIELIWAYSPQAKGRVERLFGTLQRRLVAELRLAGASTQKQANDVLHRYLIWHNRRYTVPPINPSNAHRPMQPQLNLNAIFSFHHRRSIANDYTFRFSNRLFQIQNASFGGGLRGKALRVEERLDGSIAARFRGRYLKIRELVGALPPHPRSLSDRAWRDAPKKDKGQLPLRDRQPSSLQPLTRPSGCSPAEPCPPVQHVHSTPKKPWRPPHDHPWRKPWNTSNPSPSH